MEKYEQDSKGRDKVLRMTYSWFANFAITLDNKLGANNVQTNISNYSDFKQVHQFRNDIIAIGVGANTVNVDNPSLSTKKKYLGANTEVSDPVKIIFDRSGRVSLDAKIFRNEKVPIIWITSKEMTTVPDFVHVIQPESNKQVKNRVEEVLMDLGYETGGIMIEGGSSLLFSLMKDLIINRVRIFTSNISIEDPGVIMNFPKSIQFRLLSHQRINSGYETIFALASI